MLLVYMLTNYLYHKFISQPYNVCVVRNYLMAIAQGPSKVAIRGDAQLANCQATPNQRRMACTTGANFKAKPFQAVKQCKTDRLLGHSSLAMHDRQTVGSQQPRNQLTESIHGHRR
jgi:hypothetical protein